MVQELSLMITAICCSIFGFILERLGEQKRSSRRTWYSLRMTNSYGILERSHICIIEGNKKNTVYQKLKYEPKTLLSLSLPAIFPRAKIPMTSYQPWFDVTITLDSSSKLNLLPVVVGSTYQISAALPDLTSNC